MEDVQSTTNKGTFQWAFRLLTKEKEGISENTRQRMILSDFIPPLDDGTKVSLTPLENCFFLKLPEALVGRDMFLGKANAGRNRRGKKKDDPPLRDPGVCEIKDNTLCYFVYFTKEDKRALQEVQLQFTMESPSSYTEGNKKRRGETRRWVSNVDTIKWHNGRGVDRRQKKRKSPPAETTDMEEIIGNNMVLPTLNEDSVVGAANFLSDDTGEVFVFPHPEVFVETLYYKDLYRCSDETLKENITRVSEKEIEEITQQVQDIGFYKYNFIGDDSTKYGNIAQELLTKKHLRKVVSTTKNGKHVLDDSQMIPIQMELIKKNRKRVDNLEERVDNLEGYVDGWLCTDGKSARIRRKAKADMDGYLDEEEEEEEVGENSLPKKGETTCRVCEQVVLEQDLEHHNKTSKTHFTEAEKLLAEFLFKVKDKADVRTNTLYSYCWAFLGKRDKDCDLCEGLCFQSTEDYVDHITNNEKHLSLFNQVKEETITKYGTSTECVLCRSKLGSETTFTAHMRGKAHLKTLRKLMGKEMLAKYHSLLSRPLSSTSTNTLSCRLCQLEFSSKQTYLDHVSSIKKGIHLYSFLEFSLPILRDAYLS